MREDQLAGGRNDDHDWEKISNIDVSDAVNLPLTT